MSYRGEQEDEEPRGFGKKSSGSQWSRDDQGRRYRDRDGERFYQNQSDRDEALEEKYSRCGDECCSTLLQRVSAHADELVDEYMRWAGQKMVAHYVDGDTLHEFEVERFRDRAYEAAHRRLLFAVRVRVFGDPYKRRGGDDAKPRLTPGLSGDERAERFQAALPAVVRDMPEVQGDEEPF